jgi:glycosyltransferase involved in cell wall biosynthesis
MSPAPTRVILCGPFPGPGAVGGYARVNEFIATSALAQRVGIARLPVTLPHEGTLPWRLVADVRNAHRALRSPTVQVFHLTAQYLAGTYREWLQYRLARSARCAFLLDVRGGCFAAAYDDARSPIQRRLLTDMVRGAATITVEGRSDALWIERRFEREAIHLPNFVRTADQLNFASAKLSRPEAGEPVRLAYAGQFRVEKGLRELVDACVLLEARGVPVSLSLAGVGEESFVNELRERGASLPAGRLRFLGRLDHRELLEALAKAHLFVFPSRWRGEGHSNALNEAMQVGLPIVATRHGFTADVVGPDCGRLLAAATPETLADAIAELAANWDALVACGRAARARVYSAFTDDVVLTRLEAIYRDLFARFPRG